MSDSVTTDEIETTSDTTTTEKVAMIVAGVSVAAFAAIYIRAHRKLRKMEEKEESVHVVTDLEDTTPES
jgi:hypothetical protein